MCAGAPMTTSVLETCAGLHLARLEMTALLEVLVEKVRSFDIGEPVLALNNVLRGLASLPVRVN